MTEIYTPQRKVLVHESYDEVIQELLKSTHDYIILTERIDSIKMRQVVIRKEHIVEVFSKTIVNTTVYKADKIYNILIKAGADEQNRYDFVFDVAKALLVNKVFFINEIPYVYNVIYNKVSSKYKDLTDEIVQQINKDLEELDELFPY